MERIKQKQRKKTGRKDVKSYMTREECLTLLGGRCKRCGFSDYRALQIDHVYGGGSNDTDIKTSNFYKIVVQNIGKKYQLLCANCNWIKRCENKEYGGSRGAILHYPSDYKEYASQSKYKRLELITLLGGICIRCAFTDVRALQIDHVHGNGNKVREKLSWWRIYKLIREDKTGSYQVLCANCNWIKRTENKEFLGRPKKIVQSEKHGLSRREIDARNEAIVTQKLENPSISVNVLAAEYNLSWVTIYLILRKNIRRDKFLYKTNK